VFQEPRSLPFAFFGVELEQHPDTSSPPTFVPITLVDSKPNSIEIVTPNGFTVRLNTPLSLGELLAAIASC
jgi:hypothetical protein